MSSQNKVIVSILAAIVVLGGGAFLYFNKPVAAPSAPIDELQSPPNKPADEGAKNIFDIRQSDSEVSFTLNEELRGEPTVVVGVTDQIAGQFVFDAENASAAQMGTVRVNARTLVTDSPQRNGAIARLILESEKPENELITFSPTKIEGLPNRVAVGSSFNVKITGNLKIRDITKETTFTGTVTLAAADRLTTDVSATVKRGDFNLVIPNIPFVANVQEEVTLRVNATAVSGGVASAMEGDAALGEMEQENGPAGD